MRELPQAGGGILSYFTRHRTIANLLLVVLVTLGITAVPNMRSQFFPDTIIDDISVSVSWDGAGAEDIDAAIVQILEPTLLSVEGVASSQSSSREGRASISLEFEPGWDMSRAADDVQSAVDSVNNLPEEAEEPTIRRGGWRDRVTDVMITGPVDTAQLGRFADEFVSRLFAEGVTRTTIRGVAAPGILIEVPTANLIRFDITMAEISSAIAGEVDADPAGTVTGANARVRTGVEKRSPEQIAAIVLRSDPNGTSLAISDVANIVVEGAGRSEAYYVGENPAVSVRVDRSDKGDAIKIQRQVEEVAAAMEPTLPEGSSIDLIRTRAEAITDRLDILLDNGLVGLGLVVVLLFLFLNARTALWVAAGIPVSMLAAIALMYMFGLTLNMISLFALIITTGIVVDDAIVVGEHADARARHKGESPVVAAENAARRMALPVFSATLTTVIAFFGLTAIGGRFGDMISDIPFTVIVVLIASLVECFLILPHHMSHALAHVGTKHWYDLPSHYFNRGFEWVRDRLFRPFVTAVITLRYPVLALTIVLLATQGALLIRGEVPWRFFNSPEQGSISGNFMMTEGATREDTFAQLQLLQQTVDTVGREYEAEHGTNPIVYAYGQIGGGSGRGLSGADSKDEDLLGGISIELVDPDNRPYSSFQFLSELQDRVERHPLLEELSFRGWRHGPGGDGLDVQFYGADADDLKEASESLKRALLPYPEVSAVEDNLAYDKEELILELTPQGQALGFTTDDLGRVLRNRLNGIEAATYPVGPRSATVRVELPEGELTADFLDRTQMRTSTGSYVPLADIVQVDRRTGFSTIRRENGLRLISVTGDISEDDPARATEIQQALQDQILPDIAGSLQVEYRLSGLSEQEDRFLSEATTGLILVLLGIFLVLAWVFSSWTRPLVVMAIIPFGLVGTIYGHFLWDVPLSMFSIVGLLGMTGIIINDSIVLVTTIDEHAKDRGLIPSIIEGSADRLRPVMLTTLTTVLGLSPLLYEQSSQAQFLRPTVITLVYGLGFGMILVLVIVPALIAIQNDAGRQIRAARRALRNRRARGLRLVLNATGVALFGWLIATLGLTAYSGALASPISATVPALTSLPPMTAALIAFLAGSVILSVTVYAVSAVSYGMRRRTA